MARRVVARPLTALPTSSPLPSSSSLSLFFSESLVVQIRSCSCCWGQIRSVDGQIWRLGERIWCSLTWFRLRRPEPSRHAPALLRHCACLFCWPVLRLASFIGRLVLQRASICAVAVVVRQFVGDAVVAWPPAAWLGLLQWRHGGAAYGNLVLACSQCHGGAAGSAWPRWWPQIRRHCCGSVRGAGMQMAVF